MHEVCIGLLTLCVDFPLSHVLKAHCLSLFLHMTKPLAGVPRVCSQWQPPEPLLPRDTRSSGRLPPGPAVRGAMGSHEHGPRY